MEVEKKKTSNIDTPERFFLLYTLHMKTKSYSIFDSTILVP